MKKVLRVLFLFVLALGLLAGCNGEKEVEKEAPVTQPQVEEVEVTFPVTIEDANGDQIVIEEKPERIVSLMPSNTEILFALGLENEVVGVSEHDNYPEAVLEKENIGGQDFNVEKVISLNPDLVLSHGMSTDKTEGGLKQLRDAGITVLAIPSAESFPVVYETIESIGKATGMSDQAAQIIANMKEKIAQVEEAVAQISAEERKTVFVEVSPSPNIFTTGKNTFMDEMITLVNADNAAGTEEGWVQLTEEAIIALDPAVIVTTYGYYFENPKEEVTGRKGWSDVTAVKNDQVVDVHADLVNRTGPRLAEGVEELAKAIYPEVFEK